MKKIVYVLAITCLTGLFQACTDILDTAPTNKLSSGTMWTTEESVDQGVIGVYYSLQRPVSSSGIIGAATQIGYYGYEALGMTGQGEYDIQSLFASSVKPSNGFFSFTWKWLYDGVHRANAAISGIQASSSIKEEKKARLVAECKVLRAFFYDRLNILFGNNGVGVPLYTEPVDPTECNKGQSPEAEIWAQVIQDLTDAINEPNLPNNQINGEGRVSKGAAYALRGKAYLITKDYDKAIADFAKIGDCGYGLYPDYKQLFKLGQERCEEMILSVQYIEDPTGYGTALQKYCAAFQQGSKDSRGCWTDLQVTPALVNLYEVVVDANTVKPFNWSDYLPRWEEVSALGTPNRKVFFLRDSLVNGKGIRYGSTTVTATVRTELNKLAASAQTLYIPEGNEARLKAAYANRDPRLAYNVVTPYANFLGVNSNSTAESWYTYRWPAAGKYYVDNANTEPNRNPELPADYYPSGSCNAAAEFKYIHRKFVGEGLEFLRREQNPIDEPIIRYADVLLMWAEALVEKGDLTGAMAKVKQVRDRVGIPTMASSFADQTTARNYVRDERRRELVGEGVNFFDEMRWRTLRETKFSEKVAQYVWGGTESTGGTTYDWIGDQWYTWPVPKSETELNTNLTPTPGWTY